MYVYTFKTKLSKQWTMRESQTIYTWSYYENVWWHTSASYMQDEKCQDAT